MPQSLIQLPKDADFRILKHRIIIRDYRIVSGNGLFSMILYIVDGFSSDRQTLHQLEEHGISWEMAIECCVQELEYDMQTMTGIMCWQYNVIYEYEQAGNSTSEPCRKFSDDGKVSRWDKIHTFSKSDACRRIVEQHIEKIRSCENWGELYNEMHYQSKFRKDIKRQIEMEIKE